MRLSIYAIGRMKSGPERELLERYLDRATKAGRQIGLTGVQQHDFAESRAYDVSARRREEAELLNNAAHRGAFRVALDENGRDFTSQSLSELVRGEMEQARPEMAFFIGGPDGHGEKTLGSADLQIRFGAMTWPHQIVRVMVAEQLYRVTTILSGHPYHRT